MSKREMLVVSGVGLLTFCGALFAAPEGGSLSTSTEVAAAYAGYQRITKDPVFVNLELAILCRGASQKEVEAARVKYGPHANASVVIYMNDLAAEAFRGKAAFYPAGSVVVKEKSVGSHHDDAGHRVSDGSDGVGGMIKRPAGYDPEHGDWEYFYFDRSSIAKPAAGQMPSNIESGRIASCVQCHAAARRTDYVFGAWEHPGNPFAVPTQVKLR